MWPAGWGSGQQSFPSFRSLTVPVYLRVRALRGQAPAHLWLLLCPQSLPPIQPGPGCLAPSPAVGSRDVGPCLKGGRHTEV